MYIQFNVQMGAAHLATYTVLLWIRIAQLGKGNAQQGLGTAQRGVGRHSSIEEVKP